jgi:acetylglutamate kinase
MTMEKLLVVKIGGQIVDDTAGLEDFLKKFARLPHKKILVHGGGRMATQIAESMHIPQQMVEGRRITDTETLKVVTMVYAGYINKNIVAGLQSLGCSAAGFCGADGDSIRAHKRVKSGLDYGFAGDIDKVNVEWFSSLLDRNLALVVAPITHDGKNQLLNTNADTIAQEIARAMSAAYEVTLVYGFEKTGVLLDVEDENSLIKKLAPAHFQHLKESKKIFAGMIPKLENAFTALGQGVHRVIIGKAEALDQLLTGESGTTISHE